MEIIKSRNYNGLFRKVRINNIKYLCNFSFEKPENGLMFLKIAEYSFGLIPRVNVTFVETTMPYIKFKGEKERYKYLTCNRNFIENACKQLYIIKTVKG